MRLRFLAAILAFLAGALVSSPPAHAATSRPSSCGSGFEIPDHPFLAVLGVSFDGACESHDGCYRTCGQSKAACDLRFHEALLRECRSLSMEDFGRFMCQFQADAYFAAVRVFGAGAFASARTACEACVESGETN